MERMKDDYYAGYRDYLREGMRIEIGIPLSGGGVFRDWAIVSESREDELLAQISRDVLPADVRVDEGSILDVSIWIREEVYTSSGIVIEKSGGRVLRIRLFGPFTLRERRQFFRLGLNLRLRYARVRDGSRSDLEKDWERRRALEQMKLQGYDEAVIAEERGRYRPLVPLAWNEMLWAGVNLCGAGMLINLPEPVQPDDLVALEIHLPLAPPRRVHTVAQAIHAMKPREQVKGGMLFPVGMQFLLLDERDRDLIFRHISVTQIEHLRILADRRTFPAPQPAPLEKARWQQVAVKVSWSLVVLVLAFLLVRYLVQYHESPSPNQIQKTYEKSIRKYRHME
jgi:hypothetical protein